ncbi:hypothetical protein, partial [Escherichia coli]|uniref:hypothetical protein n=1 Tax=Escherichia coli TaxID=562 RepID=UPI001BC8C81A
SLQGKISSDGCLKKEQMVVSAIASTPQSSPWHLVGVFATEEDAETEARKMGDKYEVHYGSHRTGSDDFVWGE